MVCLPGWHFSLVAIAAMKHRFVLPLLVLAVLPLPAAAVMPAEELALCERLVDRVRAEQRLRFVREGRAYGPGTAASFLQRKLDAARDRVPDCGSFVEHVGSKSITTGRPYLMREPDGTERPVLDWLTRELSALRRGGR